MELEARAVADGLVSPRRAAEELISQRLYSIILAAHAAEAGLGGKPECLPGILQLIRTQSEAALGDLLRLSGLD